MKQSGFDEILKQKMDDLMIDPPSGMWEGIESQLKGMPAPVVPAKVTKNRSLWYISGAVAAVLVAVSLLVFNRPEPTTAPFAKKEVAEPIVPTPIIMAVDSATTTPSFFIRVSKKIETVDISTNYTTPHNVEYKERTQEPTQDPEPPTKVEPRKQTPVRPIKAHRQRIHTVGLYATNFWGSSPDAGNNLGFANTQYDEVAKDYSGIDFATAPEVPTSLGVRHFVPITAGVAFVWQTTPGLGIETGVTYSYLRSEFTIGTSSSTAKRVQELHYVGVPLSLKYDLWNLGRVSIYGKAGGKIEWAVSAKNKFDKSYYDGAMAQQHSANIKAKGVVPSVGVAVGGEYRISPQFGLYFEPSANYYFPASSQPESYRTENRVSVNFGAGLRIRIR